MNVPDFLEWARELWADAQAHALEIDPVLIAPSNRGTITFGITGTVTADYHTYLMQSGHIPLVAPERTHKAYRPYFRGLGITCAMVVTPAVLLDMRLRTHVHALTALLHHPDGLDEDLWGVRMLQDGSCEPMPALDNVDHSLLGVTWLKELMS